MTDEDRRRPLHWIGWVVIILAMLFTIQASYDIWEEERDENKRAAELACLLDYNRAASHAAELEQVRSTQDREQLIRVIKALQADRDQALGRRLQEFVEHAEERNREAEANPPPDPDNYPCI